MKKQLSFLAIACAMLLTGNVMAQFNINGGISAMNTKDNVNNSDTTIGYYVGVTNNFELTSHIGIAPGVYFRSLKNDNEYNKLKATYTENSVNVPVLLNLSLNISEQSRAYIFAGPEFNIGISAKQKIVTTGDKPETMSEQNYFDADDIIRLNRFNISGTVGIGLKLDFMNFNIGLSSTLLDRRASKDIEEKGYSAFIGLGLVF